MEPQMNADERRLKFSNSRFGILNLRSSAWICGFIFLVCGCVHNPPPPKPAYKGPTEAMYDVVKETNRNNNKLPTLWASISRMQISFLDEKGKRHDETLDGTLLYRSRRDVKVVGQADVGGNV